jgi:peptidoglycan-associated lipoprotein
MENGIKFAFPVHFGFNETTVRDADRAALDRFAGVVKQYYASSNVTVEGFADPAGSASYNKRLSLKRAESVRNYLQGQGLDSQSLKAVGYGETRLVTPNAWGEQSGAELNRRVVFVIESGTPTVASADTGL